MTTTAKPKKRNPVENYALAPGAVKPKTAKPAATNSIEYRIENCTFTSAANEHTRAAAEALANAAKANAEAIKACAEALKGGSIGTCITINPDHH